MLVQSPHPLIARQSELQALAIIVPSEAPHDVVCGWSLHVFLQVVRLSTPSDGPGSGNKRHGLVLLSQYAFSLDASPLTVSSNWPFCPRRCSLCGPGSRRCACTSCPGKGLECKVQMMLPGKASASPLVIHVVHIRWPVGSLSIRPSALRSLAAVSCIHAF